MKPEDLRVVLDEELGKLLEALGLREQIESGEVLCRHCGTPVSLDTIALTSSCAPLRRAWIDLSRQPGRYVMPSVELLKLIAVTLGVPLIAVLTALFLLVYPQARAVLGDVIRAFGFMCRWVRRASLAAEMEGGINSFTKEFNPSAADEILPECRVRWVAGNNYAETLTAGSVVVRLSFGVEHDTNLYNAAATFVRHSLLPRAKAHLTSDTATALDLILIRNIVRRVKRSALRLFHEAFNSYAEPTRVVYYKLEDVDRQGLLSRILVPEYQHFGELVDERAPRPESAREADEFLNSLYQLATREQDERTLLHFARAHFGVGVILVAREETYSKYGLEPYLRRAATYASDGYRSVYLLSRGQRRGAIAKKIAKKLCEIGGFEAQLKNPDVRIGDPTAGEIITCIPLTVDHVALVQIAWERVEQARIAGDLVLASVVAVDREGIDLDVYGLRVRVENPHLGGIEILDATRYFRRGDELRVMVVEADQSTLHLAVSNVGSETDPKVIVDTFSGQAAESVIGTVIGYSTIDGLDTGLKVRFHETPTQGYISRTRASRSRFAQLREKYPLEARINVKVLRFKHEYNTWTCEVASLPDPWDTVTELHPGELCDVVIREVAERFVVGEVVEGVEGFVYPSEIAWGGDEERRQRIEALIPGEICSARVLHFDRTNRDLRLSLKRVVLSPREQFFLEVKGKIVDVEVTEIRNSGAVVRFQPTDQTGYLPIRELTWGYCDAVERLASVHEVIAVKAIDYREDLDSIIVSAKSARPNDYEALRSRTTVGGTVRGTIWTFGKGLAFVDIALNGITAAGYLHQSEVSNRQFVTPELFRKLVHKGDEYAFEIKRFDDPHRVAELSRRRWLKSHYSDLQYGTPCRCRVAPLDDRRMHLYGDELECVVPIEGLVGQEEIEVIVERKGETERDLRVHYDWPVVPSHRGRRR